ncbi:TIGR03936 family radical SAM-associated protein [Kovacikia minuta]|uniref:TIGR03936 family radical SAM-associated protein n=1 Tax=Kovacikia minuta TaxID=2931930 RepID=UPI0020C7A871
MTKQWLKEDLQRALEAATVPDCSFEGCSHCGVCGTDFGHNIVVSPLPIPHFEGHFVPNQNRVQRLRVWLGKQGEMALVSHLDLIRLFDRAIRRAALPIAFTGGFHPGPRIFPANALPLGVTSSGEIVDFELTEPMDGAIFQAKLAAQLPPDIPIYRVEPVDVSAPAATQLLELAEYTITLEPQETSATDEAESPSTQQWQQWIESVKIKDAIWQEQTTKSGKKQTVNLRDRLLELEVVRDEQVAGNQEPEEKAEGRGQRAEGQEDAGTRGHRDTENSIQNSKFKIQDSSPQPSALSPQHSSLIQNLKLKTQNPSPPPPSPSPLPRSLSAISVVAVTTVHCSAPIRSFTCWSRLRTGSFRL